ncbi:MAG: universal stress protein [Coleofasciculus sp. C2-GNP5-27]
MSWLKKNNVLVPTDFSDISFTAMTPALEFVEDISHLHVIHVLLPLSAVDPGTIWKTVTSESRQNNAKSVLKNKLSEMGYAGVQHQVSIGTPSHEIVDYAKEKGIELIVMPTHGHTGVKRVLMGSVAEQVVRLSPCPVLLLR